MLVFILFIIFPPQQAWTHMNMNENDEKSSGLDGESLGGWLCKWCVPCC